MPAAKELGLPSLFRRGHRVALKPVVELVEVTLLRRIFGVKFVGCFPAKNGREKC
jgi:hypothetical protein